MATRLAVGPIPLYHQLEQSLAARIASGEFSAGNPLPTEEQIGQAYGVSRITVRKALDSLHQQGLIVRRRGVGSFVADRSSDVRAVRLSGSLDSFLKSAYQLRPQVISLEPVEAPAAIASVFEVTTGSPVLRLELVSSGKDGPMAHCEFYFPERVIDILSMSDITADEPIVRIVERRMGLNVVRASQVIDADTAGEKTAKYLGIDKSTPLLRTQRTYYTAEGDPIEVARLRHHPQRYRYEVELRERF